MSLARTYSVALGGVTGYLIEVEADIANGLPATILVGLPDTALREARDRIRAAIINSGEQWPQRRITVGLSPASLPKRGSGFDLAIHGLCHTYPMDGNTGREYALYLRKSKGLAGISRQRTVTTAHIERHGGVI